MFVSLPADSESVSSLLAHPQMTAPLPPPPGLAGTLLLVRSAPPPLLLSPMVLSVEGQVTVHLCARPAEETCFLFISQQTHGLHEHLCRDPPARAHPPTPHSKYHGQRRARCFRSLPYWCVWCLLGELVFQLLLALKIVHPPGRMCCFTGGDPHEMSL